MKTQDELADELAEAFAVVQRSDDPAIRMEAWRRIMAVEPELDPWPFVEPDRAAIQAAAKYASDPRSYAQRNLAAEMVEILSGDGSDRPPHEYTIDHLTRLIEIARMLDPWPINVAREQILGRALTNRAIVLQQAHLGSRDENLTSAIRDAEEAVLILESDRWPMEWAEAQLARANALRDRAATLSDLDEAFRGYEAAVRIFTRDAHPKEWARIEVNRGSAFSSLRGASNVDSTECAIKCYDAALEVFAADTDSREWFAAELNRAISYFERAQGERADNLETAISGYDKLLRTREAQPVKVAQVRLNRGNAYMARVYGDREHNLSEAIDDYDYVLRTITADAMPGPWADAQNNRAGAYATRRGGDKDANLDEALAGYDAALEVYVRLQMREKWATIMANRGALLAERFHSDDGKLVEAIQAIETCLGVINRDVQPLEWANAQRNRAECYRARMEGDRAENLAAAIEGYQAALTIDQFSPDNHLTTLQLLGTALLETSDWSAARSALTLARQTADTLIGQGLNAVETERVLTKISTLGPMLAFAAVQQADSQAALLHFEECRAQQLAISLRQNDIRSALPQGDRLEFDRVRAELRHAQRALSSEPADTRAMRFDRIGALRREFSQLLERASALVSRTSVVERLAVLSAANLIIVAPIFTKWGSVLILSIPGPAGPVMVSVSLSGAAESRLWKELVSEEGWLSIYGGNYMAAEAQDTWILTWLNKIEDVGANLWSLFAGHLVATLDECGVEAGRRVVLLPQGGLGLLPIGLAQDPRTSERLFERYEFSVAPCIMSIRTQDARADQSLAAVVNPTGDLAFASVEGALVASLFDPKMRVILQEEQASAVSTLDALRRCSHWLLSCHAKYNWLDPRQSGFQLAHGESLTLDTLLEAEGLEGPRLVVLSGCETGLFDILGRPEEFVGLPVGLMQLGAGRVLSTLWPVSDVAAALLVSKFFMLHVSSGFRTAAALRAAQIWLRDATVAELRRVLDRSRVHDLPAQTKLILESFRRDLARATPTARPYSHPFHWGGFVVHGV